MFAYELDREESRLRRSVGRFLSLHQEMREDRYDDESDADSVCGDDPKTPENLIAN